MQYLKQLYQAAMDVFTRFLSSKYNKLNGTDTSVPEPPSDSFDSSESQ